MPFPKSFPKMNYSRVRTVKHKHDKGFTRMFFRGRQKLVGVSVHSGKSVTDIAFKGRKILAKHSYKSRR